MPPNCRSMRRRPVNAPASEWNSWARQAVTPRSSQAAALVVGDETRYLAPPTRPTTRLVAELQRRFRWCARWASGSVDQAIRTGPRSVRRALLERRHQDLVLLRRRRPAAVTAVVLTRWRVHNDRLWLTTLAASRVGPERPAAVGDRSSWHRHRGTRSSSPPPAQQRPPGGRGRRGGRRPRSPTRWPSGAGAQPVRHLPGRPDRVDHVVRPRATGLGGRPGRSRSATDTEVVVRTEVVQQRSLENLLTHELTHVTSMAGKRGRCGERRGG